MFCFKGTSYFPHGKIVPIQTVINHEIRPDEMTRVNIKFQQSFICYITIFQIYNGLVYFVKLIITALYEVNPL